jgi:hypothetical protein
VSDQGQAEPALESSEPVREKLRRRFVDVGSASQRIGALPLAVTPFGIEPAVQLNVAEANVRGLEFIPHLQERGGIIQAVLEAVVVPRPVVGPIAEMSQAEIGVIGRTLLAGQVRQESTPGLECAIDAGLDR